MSKKILVAHLGGTVGMVKTTEGLAPPENARQYRNEMLPELQEAHPDTEFLFASLFTEDSNEVNAEVLEETAAYVRFAESELGIDATLSTHGTDTADITAASFNVLFQGSTGPYLCSPFGLTAAQKILTMKPGDAKNNLLETAQTLHFLSDQSYYPFIPFVFNHEVLNGAHIIKVSEGKYDAFKAVTGISNLGDIEGEHINWGNNLPKHIALSIALRKKRLLHMRGKSLPFGKYLLSPLNVTGDRIEEGGYVHPVDVGTLDSSISYSLQGQDKRCLGILFYLAGIGNTGMKNFKPVSNLVKAYGIPIRGVLSIPGGQANQDLYKLGKEAFEAGIVSGHDISPALARAKFQWVLANMNSKDNVEFLNKMSLSYDLADVFRDSVEVSKIPDIYQTTPTDHNNSFAERLARAQSLVEAYRVYKGRKFRWITVPEEHAEEAAKFLPESNSGKILPEHKNFDFAATTGWTPPDRH